MLRRNPKVEEAPLQNDLMLFHPERAQFFVLNPTMAFIWRHCDGSASIDELIAGIASEFEGVDKVAAAEDVQKACQELLSQDLVIDSNPAMA